MEAALRKVLHETFGEYAQGLENVDCSRMPLVLNNLKLKEKVINEAMEDSPFDFKDGLIGQVQVSAGWMGGIEVKATGIALNLAFNPMKAMRNAMKPEEPDYEEEYCPPQVPQAPAAPVPPRFCPNHDSSEKRSKGEPREQECKNCHIRLQTSYTDFSLCPPCSERQRRCMICGCDAPNNGSYVPATSADAPPKSHGNCAHDAPAHRNFSRDLDLPPPPPPRPSEKQRPGPCQARQLDRIEPPPQPPTRCGGVGASFEFGRQSDHGWAKGPDVPMGGVDGRGAAPQWGRGGAPQSNGFPPMSTIPPGVAQNGAFATQNAPAQYPGYQNQNLSPSNQLGANGGVFGMGNLDDVSTVFMKLFDFRSWAAHGNCNADPRWGKPGSSRIENIAGPGPHRGLR
jgi:hypothetical protein